MNDNTIRDQDIKLARRLLYLCNSKQDIECLIVALTEQLEDYKRVVLKFISKDDQECDWETNVDWKKKAEHYEELWCESRREKALVESELEVAKKANASLAKEAIESEKKITELTKEIEALKNEKKKDMGIVQIAGYDINWDENTIKVLGRVLANGIEFELEGLQYLRPIRKIERGPSV